MSIEVQQILVCSVQRQHVGTHILSSHRQYTYIQTGTPHPPRAYKHEKKKKVYELKQATKRQSLRGKKKNLTQVCLPRD